ncbi:hypothetical protein EDB92DRAFT_1843248 [Lactarius akahatsu]|uniref:Uncharacterized protein n=1 Tax=Lactarius akahatsu TaxID=416441 RepID=A0AAD4QFX8_9AGAM|nr:hypothetical protein EDB92DRAFT_1843248 [Lactarius akahatsu]
MTVPFMTNTAVGKHPVDFLPSQMHVQHENSCPLFPEEDVGMDIFPRLRVTEHSIGLSPSASPNYVASPLPYPTAPSSLDRWIPRIYHGVERRQRLRPSSRGAEPYPKRTRGERTAIETVSSRRWDAAEDAHQIASSSLWIAPVPAAKIHTKVHTKHPPTPTIISHEHSPLRGAFAERDDSPGFDGDIESGVAARRGQRARVGTRERLTIVVPGGKSEAYVAMAFERSCSLTGGDHHGSYIFPTTLSPPRVRKPPREERTVRRTGLKIRIPAPNPLLLLSLRLADSCRITTTDMDTTRDEDGDDEDSDEYSEAFSSPELEYTSSCSSANVGSDVRQGPLVQCSTLARVPTLEGRVARRVAHRTALAPYTIDRSRNIRLIH